MKFGGALPRYCRKERRHALASAASLSFWGDWGTIVTNDVMPHDTRERAISEVMGERLPSDTMGGLFWHRVRSQPHGVGFIFENTRFTNRQFAELVNYFRASLRRDGAVRGSRVAAFMYNSPNSLALFLACASEGIVFCPINVALRRSDLAYTLGDVRPS